MMPPGWRGSLADDFCLTGEAVWSRRLRLFIAGAAQAFAGKFDAVGVVDEAVQDGVGIGGVADNFVPGCHGKLGSDDGRTTAVSLFEDFEEVVTGAGVERLQAKVVEDEEVGAAEGFQEARMTPVAVRQDEILTELGPTVIEHGTIVAACLLADSASEPTLADAARTDESKIIVGVDPLTVGEFLEQSAVEPARTAIVDIFDRCLLAKPRGAQPSCQSFVVPPGDFAVQEKPEPFVMAKAVRLVDAGDFHEGLGHSVKAQCVELVKSGMFEQDRFS